MRQGIILLAALNCITQPTYTELGYSKSGVDNCDSYVYCPFDTTYKACINKGEAFTCTIETLDDLLKYAGHASCPTVYLGKSLDISSSADVAADRVITFADNQNFESKNNAYYTLTLSNQQLRFGNDAQIKGVNLTWKNLSDNREAIVFENDGSITGAYIAFGGADNATIKGNNVTFEDYDYQCGIYNNNSISILDIANLNISSYFTTSSLGIEGDSCSLSNYANLELYGSDYTLTINSKNFNLSKNASINIASNNRNSGLLTIGSDTATIDGRIYLETFLDSSTELDGQTGLLALSGKTTVNGGISLYADGYYVPGIENCYDNGYEDCLQDYTDGPWICTWIDDYQCYLDQPVPGCAISASGSAELIINGKVSLTMFPGFYEAVDMISEGNGYTYKTCGNLKITGTLTDIQ